MSTIILAVVLFAAVAYVTYLRFFKKTGSNCHDCSDVGCPLSDQMHMINQNNHKQA
ncbi:FeoB-associated Cys-rich membrane protein [Loigolactobacillus bifermentans]|jgi:hypothetical protein|uniref:FeoB-associated Cys-rich membrane protein n=1 Tax=Loigolactobacillus bifermentans DSM 20003 TaxID=1423726 RepID=A0A0R1H344_9LACO|nr:FeoB-associated Cys-rich membrane protein [Loigolactobacillus bifermentans]KRK40957.1 hypothetical protein FC07_GL001655 [Loigolactobacillus bifermentans DSM 20003]QGG59957.1 FeoB-associated Cys-rich membrane protein [Loigolactobacillus bifermentans]